MAPRPSDPNDLGRHVIAARRRLGLTQAEVAEKAGVSMKTVGNLERGKYVAQSGTTDAVLSALGIGPDSPDYPLFEPSLDMDGWTTEVCAYVQVIGDHLASLSAEERAVQYARWAIGSASTADG